ncbi:MAG: mandelate racemase/muconate lactonizing enzyme family protein [Alphaproteobacteria bacterium]|nr:mandelate racemase/muconate lactonizing enzyme family protein [Alphaproteobacteria bacterium]
MKITRVTTSTMVVPNDPPVSTYYGANTYVVARIETDAGITGLGYTMLVGGMGSRAVRAYMEESLVPLVVGADPLHIGGIWQRMYENDRGIRKKGIPVYAMSAIDIGLWDILGKSVGRPVWHLLGAQTDRAPVYGSGGFLPYTVDQIVAEAEMFRALGCRHYKFKIGRPNVIENVERVRLVREALGDDMDILVDANQRWDLATNIRVGRMLEEYGLFWYEEPVLADNIDQCAEVAMSISIPVATGENEYTRYGFRDLIATKAAQYLNPDIHRCGGFSEMMKISHLAAAYDIKVAPHLVPELSVSVLVAIPNGSLVEVLAGSPEDLWEDMPKIVDGHMAPPDRPGHGMEFSAGAVKRYTVD